MTLLNRDIFGRRVQFLVAMPRNDDFTVRAWWDAISVRRSRGLWPRSGPFPLFRYWALGPFDLRIFLRDRRKA